MSNVHYLPHPRQTRLNTAQAEALLTITRTEQGPVEINQGAKGNVMAATERTLFVILPSGVVEEHPRAPEGNAA